MTRIQLDIYDDTVVTLEKIKNVNDTGIELVIPLGSVLFENIVNLKLLKKEAERRGKVLHYETEDEAGLTLLSQLELGGQDTTTVFHEDSDYSGHIAERPGQTSVSPQAQESMVFPTEGARRGRGGRGGGLKFAFRLPRVPARALIVGGILLAVLGAGGYFGFSKVVGKVISLPHAKAIIKVESQPLTKSVTIKVVQSGETDVDGKLLKGEVQTVTVAETKTTTTTGEKDVGEKATGGVLFYNKTDDSKKFKKGKTLKYERNGETLEFALTKDVEVSARTQLSVEEDEDGNDVYVYQKGEATGEAEAKDVGEEYNIKDSSDLDIDGEKSSQVSAEADGKFKGGKSEVAQVVSEADRTDLAGKLLDDLEGNAEKELGTKAGKAQKMIGGSTQTTVNSQEFSHEVGDETETLELTTTATVDSLFYNAEDLDKLLEKILGDLIPEGYELSSKEKEVTVEVLGNTTDAVLTFNEADIQVTVKAHVIPKIDAEEIKNEIKGKDADAARRILDKLKDVTHYELEISPNIPFFGNVPENTDRIEIDIVKE